MPLLEGSEGALSLCAICLRLLSPDLSGLGVDLGQGFGSGVGVGADCDCGSCGRSFETPPDDSIRAEEFAHSVVTKRKLMMHNGSKAKEASL